MDSLAIAIAASPGPPLGSIAVGTESVFVPMGLALLGVLVLGAIVLWVGRDRVRSTRVPPLRPAIRIEERSPELRRQA